MSTGSQYERAVRIQHRWRTDGTEEIRVAASDASLLVVSLGPDQVLRLEARDRPPRGEEGTDLVALTLIERLNRSGGGWNEPQRPQGPEEGIDFTSIGPNGPLNIQVTRSFTDLSAWRQFARESSVEFSIPVQDAVDGVWKAIEAKARRIAPAVRAGLCLAVDTTMPPIYATRSFMAALRSRRATDIGALGFEQVWLVGPTDMLTWRVDEPFPPGSRNIT